MEIIPKVELVPVVVPERIKIDKVFVPPDASPGSGTKARRSAAKSQSTGKKKKAADKDPGSLFKGEQYEVDVDKATNIINNTHK